MVFQRFGTKAPPPLKGLLWALFLVSLLTALVQPLRAALSLSLEGLAHGFVWQLFTYPFAAIGPASFGLLIGLAFVLYLIWSVGGLVMERVGVGPFFRFFFITAAIAGLLTMICALGLGNKPVAGTTPALYALLMALLSFGTGGGPVLFMMVPFQARTLLLSLMAFNVAIDLAAQEWISALANTFGALSGYLYTILVWDLRGPFVTCHPIEGRLAAIGRLVRRTFRLDESGYGRSVPTYTPKQSAEDEAFLESMLTKVSEKGHESLTFWERWKIKRVTKRRRRG
ncbi:MAG: rhomboid family intramembrane serine protease [Parachlamydiales bacterium]